MYIGVSSTNFMMMMKTAIKAINVRQAMYLQLRSIRKIKAIVISPIAQAICIPTP